MNLITMIAIPTISLVFTMVFVVGLKSRGPWGSGWTFFSIVCLWLVAVSLWIPPAAPVWFGVPLIDLIITGLLISFVLSATSIGTSSSADYLHGKDDSQQETTNESRKESGIHKNEFTSGKGIRTSERAGSLAVRNEHFAHATRSGKAHESSEKHERLHAGGFFWMLLLCLCALIIIGAA